MVSKCLADISDLGSPRGELARTYQPTLVQGCSYGCRQADCKASSPRTGLDTGVIHTDLKPENVLVCIEDVGTIVETELQMTPAATLDPPGWRFA